jgi:hypothetical protein
MCTLRLNASDTVLPQILHWKGLPNASVSAVDVDGCCWCCMCDGLGSRRIILLAGIPVCGIYLYLLLAHDSVERMI